MLRSLLFALLLLVALLWAVSVFTTAGNDLTPLQAAAPLAFQPTAATAMIITVTTITVTTTSDELNSDGDCSLREAIQAAYLDSAADACVAGSGSDTVTIPAGQYTLTLGQLHLTGTVTLQGSMTATTSLDGNHQSRVLNIAGDAQVILRYLDISNGYLPHCYQCDDGAEGAGVMNRGMTWIDHAVIHDNQAGTTESNPYDTHGASGGGIFNTGLLTITNSTVSGNAAGNGDSYGNGHAGERYCSPGGEGGGIANFGVLTLDNATVANNNAGTGGPQDENLCERPDGSGDVGGLYNADAGIVYVKNSIIAGNANSDCRGVITSRGFNVIQANEPSRGSAYENCTIHGDVILWDAYLRPLANNGGPTLTHALSAGSLAIDAGACFDSAGITVTVDQRGASRPQGESCDIGAYESSYTATFRLVDTGLPWVAYQPSPCEKSIPACNLTNAPNIRDEDPSWSPDGQKIAFWRNKWKDGDLIDGGIFVMNADGSKPVQLTMQGCAPAWSPDSDQIAFISPCYYGISEIYVMNADGTNVRSLTNIEAGGAIIPTWSPDGSKLLYQVEYLTRAIFVMNADGSQNIQLATDAFLGRSPWSPDGNQIIFVDMSSGPDGIIRMINADGSNATVLNADAPYKHSPAWSPEGSKIAFICSGIGGPSDDVCIASRDGSGVTRLTDHEFNYIANLSWSPAGDKLLLLGALHPDAYYEVFVMNSDGSQRRQLTSKPEGSWTDDAVWAPDGRKIAFVRGSAENLEIYVLGIGE